MGNPNLYCLVTKNQIWLTKRHENMQWRAKILGTNFKKKTSVFYHQIQKKITPSQQCPQCFSERIICHTFLFQASQKELEELERALQGLEQAMNGKWFPAPNSQRWWKTSQKPKPALYSIDAIDTLGALVAQKRYDPVQIAKESAKKRWGGGDVVNLGELPAECYFFASY